MTVKQRLFLTLCFTRPSQPACLQKPTPDTARRKWTEQNPLVCFHFKYTNHELCATLGFALDTIRFASFPPQTAPSGAPGGVTSCSFLWHHWVGRHQMSSNLLTFIIGNHVSRRSRCRFTFQTPMTETSQSFSLTDGHGCMSKTKYFRLFASSTRR